MYQPLSEGLADLKRRTDEFPCNNRQMRLQATRR